MPSAGWAVARDAVTSVPCGFSLRLRAGGGLLLRVWQATGTRGPAPSPSGGREVVTASPRPPRSGCLTAEMRRANVLAEGAQKGASCEAVPLGIVFETESQTFLEKYREALNALGRVHWSRRLLWAVQHETGPPSVHSRASPRAGSAGGRRGPAQSPVTRAGGLAGLPWPA